jgi:putative ABC transport system permease protein
VPDVAWVHASTGQDVIAEDLGRQRLGAWFFSGFGLVALVLVVGGVFGLVAYLADSRQREFGLRVALGATSGDLVRGCVWVAIVPVAAGLAGGLLLAALVARLFSAVLLGSVLVDPLVYAAVSVLMIGGAMVAALGAAWRLRRLTPLDALRVT